MQNIATTLAGVGEEPLTFGQDPLADIAARNSIPAIARKNGLIVSLANGTQYRYIGADFTAVNTSWEEYRADIQEVDINNLFV